MNDSHQIMAGLLRGDAPAPLVPPIRSQAPATAAAIPAAATPALAEKIQFDDSEGEELGEEWRHAVPWVMCSTVRTPVVRRLSVWVRRCGRRGAL